MQSLKFALKNVLRNRRRSFTTILIAAIGTAAMVSAGGFVLFAYQILTDTSTRELGHFVLSHRDYYEKEEEKPLQLGLTDHARVRQALEADAAGLGKPLRRHAQPQLGHFIRAHAQRVPAVVDAVLDVFLLELGHHRAGVLSGEVRVERECLIKLIGNVKKDVLVNAAIVCVEVPVIPLVGGIGRALVIVP